MTDSVQAQLEAVLRGIEEAGNRLATYRAHLRGCEVDQTEFCTCGLRQAVDGWAAALRAGEDQKETL